MEVWANLSVEQKLTVFLAFGSAVLGSVLATATGYLSFFRENKHKANLEMEAEARKAQSAFVKMFLFYNVVEGAVHTIKVQRERYSGVEFEDMALNQKVRGVSGLCDGLEKIHLDEVSFLFRTQSPMLFSEVLLLEKRTRNLARYFEGYGVSRENLIGEYEAFLSDSKRGSEHLASAFVPAVQRIRLDKMSASLDRTISRIEGDFEELIEDIKNTCDQYLLAAKSEFGVRFPDVSVEWKSSIATERSRRDEQC